MQKGLWFAWKNKIIQQIEIFLKNIISRLVAKRMEAEVTLAEEEHENNLLSEDICRLEARIAVLQQNSKTGGEEWLLPILDHQLFHFFKNPECI